MDLSEYVGIPFKSRGRERTGADCWGIVWMVYREVLKIELPSYSEDYFCDADRENVSRLIEGARFAWTRVSPGLEQQGDLALLVLFGHDHIGVVAERTKILHTQAVGGAQLEDYTGPHLRSRMRGFYRWRG